MTGGITHRCPFCHESIGTGAPDRVTCQACEAAHHAECFLESEGCATTACKHPIARVGYVEVPLEMLTHLVTQPERFRQLASLPPPSQGFGAKLLAALGVIIFFALMGAVGAGTLESTPYLGGAAVGAFLGFVLSALVFSGGSSTPSTPSRLHALGQPSVEFDPIFGTWTSSFVPGLLPSTPGDELREQLRKSAPAQETPTPPGEPPERCPDCAQELETADPSTYCYHCGAGLVDIAGRWRVKE